MQVLQGSGRQILSSARPGAPSAGRGRVLRDRDLCGLEPEVQPGAQAAAWGAGRAWQQVHRGAGRKPGPGARRLLAGERAGLRDWDPVE